jgi:tRNA 2-thiocytidine biosynthesis protein TtcA
MVSDLEHKIQKRVGQAIGDFNLIDEGDRILVALSGGKDSHTLVHILEKLRRKAPVSFELQVINIDPGFEGYDGQSLVDYLEENRYSYRMHRANIARVLEEKLKPDEQRCSLCARLRRGVLYKLAPEMGCNKIALGHHKDDLVETLLLNLFFSGQLKSMPPILYAEDKKNIVIRPLAYVEEQDIIDFAAEKNFPIVTMPCPAAGVNDNQQRREVKSMLAKLDEQYPNIKSSILTAMKNVVTSHLLDRRYS